VSRYSWHEAAGQGVMRPEVREPKFLPTSCRMTADSKCSTHTFRMPPAPLQGCALMFVAPAVQELCIGGRCHFDRGGHVYMQLAAPPPLVYLPANLSPPPPRALCRTRTLP
jgi:hypothetical protein